MHTVNTENLVKASHVIGLKVLAKDNGSQFARVKDIMYDPRTQRVAYLITDEGGWFSKAKVIPFSSIDIIGPDRVMVPNAHAEVTVSMVGYDLNTLIQNDDIIKNLNVVTEKGEKLGKVVDFYFDAESGIVREFKVSQGLVDDITNGTKHMRVSKINVVGIDAVIVTPETSMEFEDQAVQQGVKGALNIAGAAIASTADTAKEQLSNLAEEAKDAAITAKDKTVEVTQNATESAKPHLENAQAKISQVATDTQTKISENTPNSKEEWVDASKQKASEVKDTIQSGAHNVADFVKGKVNEAKDGIEEAKVKKALGNILTKNLIDPKNNTTIAFRGQTIDAEIVDKAKSLGVLDMVTDADSYMSSAV